MVNPGFKVIQGWPWTFGKVHIQWYAFCILLQKLFKVLWRLKISDWQEKFRFQMCFKRFLNEKKSQKKIFFFRKFFGVDPFFKGQSAKYRQKYFFLALCIMDVKKSRQQHKYCGHAWKCNCQISRLSILDLSCITNSHVNNLQKLISVTGKKEFSLPKCLYDNYKDIKR